MTVLRDRWAAGEVTYGGWCSYDSVGVAEALGAAGFDHVCVDLQHGLSRVGDLPAMILAIEAGGAEALVRVPGNEPEVIGSALDLGAAGVIVPLVNSAAEAAAAVAACRYPPEGRRSWGPARPRMRDDGYAARANDEVACIVMIETAEALAELDAIVSVPGITAVYVGPSDLSLGLGLAPGNNDGVEAFDDALAVVATTCAAHGVVAGVHATAELAGARAAVGFTMITVLTDTAAVRSSAATALQTARDG